MRMYGRIINIQHSPYLVAHFTREITYVAGVNTHQSSDYDAETVALSCHERKCE